LAFGKALAAIMGSWYMRADGKRRILWLEIGKWSVFSVWDRLGERKPAISELGGSEACFNRLLETVFRNFMICSG